LFTESNELKVVNLKKMDVSKIDIMS